MPPRPTVTLICLVALGVALACAAFVDRTGETSGRSSLAREARGFAQAMHEGSSHVLDYVTEADREDPQAIARLRALLLGLGPGADLMVSRVRVDPAGAEGTSEILVARLSPRGPIAEDQLNVTWERSPGGPWKARILGR
jgi:hypothetical protein